MLPNTRVSTTMDTGRSGQALARPGMDTRTWVSLAHVLAVVIDPAEGVFVDVQTMPDEDLFTARLGGAYAGPHYGSYFPLQVGDEVIVEAPDGDPDHGVIISSRLHSKSDPPPQEVIDSPNDAVVHLRSGVNYRIVVEAGANVVLKTQDGDVQLASEGLGVTDGLVHGSFDEPYTGVPFWLLGATCARVKGSKD